MDRKTFYENTKDRILKIAKDPLVKGKMEIDSRKLTFEGLLEKLGKENFTGYINASSNYRWHTLMIESHIRFSAFLSKGVTLQGKDAILSMKSKWQNPPVTIQAFTLSKDAVHAYFGMFGGVKLFDGTNPETLGIERIFEKIKEEQFTGPVIFDTKDNKIIFLWYKGEIIHIFPARNITLTCEEKEIEEVFISPFLNITAIRSYKMSLDIPYEKMLYTKRSSEINGMLDKFQEALKDMIGTRVMSLIAKDIKQELMKKHMFYQDLIKLQGYKISFEPKIMDRGLTRDLDEVIREVLEVYIQRAREDAGNLVMKYFRDFSGKGDVDNAEKN